MIPDQPPSWLTALVPYLGNHQAREAWAELVDDSITLKVLFSICFGKWVETSVVIYAGSSSDWRLWSVWGGLSVATFSAIVLGWWFHRLYEQAAEAASAAAEEGAEKVDEAVESVGEAVDEATGDS